MRELIAKLEEELERRRAELDALARAVATIKAQLVDEAAAVVPSALEPLPTPGFRKQSPTGPLASRTISQCIRSIFDQEIGSLSAREVAKIALDRGYRGVGQNSDLNVAERSFTEYLKRAKWLKQSDGRYSRDPLSSQGEPEPQPKRRAGHPRGVDRAEVIASVIRRHAKPVNIRTIIEGLREANQPVPGDRRCAYNSVFGSLRKAPSVFEMLGDGMWALREWNINGSTHAPQAFEGAQTTNEATPLARSTPRH